MRKLGILASGGDAPGMNAAIRAAVRTASRLGLEMVGYLDGFTGLLAGNHIRLEDRAVGNIIQRGGTFLGTSRCPEFMEVEARARAAEGMRTADVEGLVIIGGDGSFRGALALHQEQGVAVSGVPGTIDNDVWGTDETIGFDTALNTAVLAIDQVRDTSESTGMMFFVEVMGRASGALALHTALAAGAAGVLVPEGHESFDALARRLRQSIARGKRSHIVVVSEAEQAGGAFEVARRVGALLDHPYREEVLGHVQRGGRPSARDRLIAGQMGSLAVEALAAGREAMMIGMRGSRPVEVPLVEVVAHGHPQPEHDLLHLAETLAG